MSKPLVWLGTALDDVRAFPEDARRRAGHELFQVQIGARPSDWKPMPSVGAGVVEIRIHTRLEHRVMYVVAVQGEVHVLHAFEKKTQKTRDADLDLARVRLKALRAAAASRKP